MSRLNSYWGKWCKLSGLVTAAIVVVQVIGWRATERYIAGAVQVPEQLALAVWGAL